MMRAVKKSIVSVVALATACSAVVFGSVATPYGQGSTVVSALSYGDVCTESTSDVWAYNALPMQNGNTSEPNSTYLQSNSDGTFSRIVYADDSLTVETYSSEYERISSQSVDMELPIWGGFYSGSEYNFCVFGASNEEEDNRETIRVVKYSKSWERLDSASYYGVDTNTQTPFTAGRPRMDERNGILYLHTSHRMLAIDGVNHQSTLELYLNVEDMSTVFQQSDVGMVDWNGYISHSFDQYVQTDSENVYTLDLGDAYPRGVAIVKRSLDGTFLDTTNVFDIYGSVGNNTTGVTLGGFALTDSGCISVGSSIAQDGSADTSYERNVFVGVTSKDLSSSRVVWLTDFDYESGTTTSRVSAPKLVEAGDGFVALWNETSDDGDLYLHVVRLNSEGETLEDVTVDGVRLSDCDPIVLGDQLVWYYCGYDTDGTDDVWYYDWSEESSKVNCVYHIDYTNLSQYDGATLDPSAVVVGDCNSDGSVTPLDLLVLKKYILGIDVSIDLDGADTNRDGTVDLLDLMTLKRYVLGIGTL